MYLFAGNRAAYSDEPANPDGSTKAAKDRAPLVEGKNRTEVVYPDGTTLGEAFKTFTDPGGIWAAHSPDAAPAWVASSNASLAAFIGEHYGCEVRDPLPEGENGEHAARVHHFAALEG